jgi:hypothetical protein
MIGFSPCGACGEYVPSAFGCGHWTPGLKLEGPRTARKSREAIAEKSRKYRAKKKAEAEEVRARRHREEL